MSLHPALQSVALLRTWTEEDFPGSVFSFDLFEFTAEMAGFVISADGGSALVMTDVTGNPTGPWAVQVGGGLALDVPDLAGPLNWVNTRNRASVHGRYFCALAEAQGLSATVYVEFLHGVLFEYLRQGSMSRWLRALVGNVVESAVQEGREMVTTYGGRAFEPDDRDLMTLFTIMGS